MFMSKKQKLKMRQRKRKLDKAKKTDETGAVTEDTAEDVSEATPTKSTEGKQDEKEDEQEQKQIDTPNDPPSRVVIGLPSGMTTEKLKKFRKDSRRKARKNNSTVEVIFVEEGKEHLYVEEKTEEIKEPPKKKRKKTFPKIKELLEQERQGKIAEKKKDFANQSNSQLGEVEQARYVGLDCEMVGIGAGGKESALARASIVDFSGKVLLDTFVQVPAPVTDFRTKVSGVRAKDITPYKNPNAITIRESQTAVGNILHGKILVGHALKNDMKVLMLDHPREDVRDTASYRPFMKSVGKNGGKFRPRRLKELASEFIELDIQMEGMEHNSVDDARAAMELYKLVRLNWEKERTFKQQSSKK